MKLHFFIKKILNRLELYASRNYKIFLSKLVYYKIAHLNDRLKGVDFFKHISLEDLGYKSDSGNMHYSSTRPYELRKVLKICKFKTEDTVLDLGCGKGTALLEFSKFNFKLITGCDLNENVISIAKNNFAKLDIKNVELSCRDATLITNDLDKYTFFYLANPFGGEVFQKVINNIVNSLSRVPREITIIYYYPIEHQIIVNSKSFALQKIYTPYFFGGDFYIYNNVRIKQH